MYIKLSDRIAEIHGEELPFTISQDEVRLFPLPDNNKIEYYISNIKIDVSGYQNTENYYTDLFSTIVEGYPSENEIFIVVKNENDVNYLLNKFKKISFTWVNKEGRKNDF